MYACAQQLNTPSSHYSSPDGGGDCPGGGGVSESIENSQMGFYEAKQLDDGGAVALSGMEVSSASVPHQDGGPVHADVAMLPRGIGDPANQLTLSFRGQVYVFDAVTTEKVQNVLLLLGGCEYTPGAQGVGLPFQQDMTEYPIRCSDPKRAASLTRFRQKRKERCFEKKIRYNVRQEVALKMQRKKGQFAPRKSEDSNTWDSVEESGQEDNPVETTCTHCGTSSKATPMMRKGPAGPRTLCNACGLVWANKGILRDLSKRYHNNNIAAAEEVGVHFKDEGDSESDYATRIP